MTHVLVLDASDVGVTKPTVADEELGERNVPDGVAKPVGVAVATISVIIEGEVGEVVEIIKVDVKCVMRLEAKLSVDKLSLGEEVTEVELDELVVNVIELDEQCFCYC